MWCASGRQALLLLEQGGGAPFRREGYATAAPLLTKRLLERARVVPMDRVDGDRVNNALSFRRLFGKDKEAHQYTLTQCG